MIGLLRNDVQLMASDIPGALEHIRAGKLRALAYTGTTRMPQLPDLPTLAEAGVDGLRGGGLPRHHGARRHAAGGGRDAQPRDQRRAQVAGAQPSTSPTTGSAAGGGTPADFAAFLQRDRAIWSRVIAAGGIKAE